MNWRLLASGLFLAGLSGCRPSYSPDTYASNAVQQANKVEQGVVVGVRQVGVSASGTVGTVTGAAAGGIAGAQVGTGPVSAFSALGGSLVGGLAGSAVEHVSADTKAFEYIVRKPNGDLVSVTQKDTVPLALGQKVLVIAGNQARVVPDYTLPPDVSAAKADKPAGQEKPPDAARNDQPASGAKPADGSGANAPDGSAAKPAEPPAADVKPADSAAGNAPPPGTAQPAGAPASASEPPPPAANASPPAAAGK